MIDKNGEEKNSWLKTIRRITPKIGYEMCGFLKHKSWWLDLCEDHCYQLRVTYYTNSKYFWDGAQFRPPMQ